MIAEQDGSQILLVELIQTSKHTIDRSTMLKAKTMLIVRNMMGFKLVRLYFTDSVLGAAKKSDGIFDGS